MKPRSALSWVAFQFLVACGSTEPAEAAAQEPVESAVEEPASASQPAAAEEDTGEEAPMRTGEEAPLDARTDERLAARHLIVAYRGARGVPPGVTRSRKEARARAAKIRERLVAGEDFAVVARETSDGPSRALGGMLGSFEPGVMDPIFERALVQLDEEQLSDIVETPYGFHLIQRLPVVEYRLAQVLVQWTGRRHAKVERTREEALQLAEAARAALLGGQAVAEVARSHSDGPSASYGGELGWMQKGQMVKVFDEAAFGLDVGGVSPVVESPLGFHVIVRLE